jgi:heme exporter protein D
LTSSQKTALVVLLVTWVFVVLAVLPLATLAAQAIAPAPPLHKVEAQKKAVDTQLNRQADLDMGKVYFKIVGEDHGFGDPDAFQKHRDVIEPAIAPILLDYVSKRRQKLSEIDREAERQEERQNEITHGLMAMSPAAAFASGVAELTGTGDAYYTAWWEAVHRQQSRLDSALFDDPIIIGFTHPMQHFGLGLNRREGPPLAQLPAFVPPRRDALAALARALPALGLLIGYTGVFIVASFAAFARYDVR